MKLKFKTPVLPLLSAMIIALACLACEDQGAKPLGTEADLTALRIESSGATVVTDTSSKVADPIPASIMDKEDLTAADLYGPDFDQTGTTIGWVDIRVRNKETGKINGRLRPVMSRGARAQWGIGTRSTRPDAFYDTRVPATLDNDEFIYIRVTSEDGEIVNYYRFYAKLLSWTTNLQYIRVGNREGKAGANIHGQSAGGSAWNKILGMPSDDRNPDGTPKSYSPLTFSIAQKEGQNVVVDAVAFDPNATVRYAVVANDTTEPTNFTPDKQPLNIKDQDYLYVEVTAENTLDKEYFRFQVSVGRLANIASLKLTGSPKGDFDVYGIGLPQPDWGKVISGEFQTADQPTAGFKIELVPDDPDATIVYGKIANDNEPKPGSFPNTITNTNPIMFVNDPVTQAPNVLAIQVTSANGVVTYFYKIRVTNLAANIIQHPKSAWYYRDDIKSQGVSEEGRRAVVPLTVELDRPGNYSYQWYEADSWYGTYGRHGTSLDEKNNITTVNGGPGQYFYLVQPDEFPENRQADGYTPNLAPYWVDRARGGDELVNGIPWGYLAWSIQGANSQSYTPPTNWEDVDTVHMEFYGTAAQNASYPKPLQPPRVYFLSGSTNESRYYWVKVTNLTTGLSVVSNRALILTETKPNMDHFIFDLSSLPSKKNVVPFTKEGTAYDNIYKIPTKDYPFPSDFDDKVGNYQICIAHAQYFLPDGRAWTQNWTHGNFHMGMDDGSLIWYQNNMGANGGAIPLQAPHSQQGGLSQKPDWIGFTPSGDPAKGLPRPVNAAGDLPKGIYSMAATDPYPAGVAQGYFAAFIELLEVRFQTAPSD